MQGRRKDVKNKMRKERRTQGGTCNNMFKVEAPVKLEVKCNLSKIIHTPSRFRFKVGFT